MINDDLPLKILSGSVIIKPNVSEIRGSTVVFDDGSVVEKVRALYFQGNPQEYFSISQFKALTHLFSVTGGYYCVCHRLRIWFSILA